MTFLPLRFRAQLVIWSGPGALLFGSLRMMFQISPGEKKMVFLGEIFLECWVMVSVTSCSMLLGVVVVLN